MIRSTFAIPAILGVVTIVGLIVALAGDGWPDAAAWLSLALPIIAVGWAVRRTSSRSTSAAYAKGMTRR